MSSTNFGGNISTIGDEPSYKETDYSMFKKDESHLKPSAALSTKEEKYPSGPDAGIVTETSASKRTKTPEWISLLYSSSKQQPVR